MKVLLSVMCFGSLMWVVLVGRMYCLCWVCGSGGVCWCCWIIMVWFGIVCR